MLLQNFHTFQHTKPKANKQISKKEEKNRIDRYYYLKNTISYCHYYPLNC